MVVLIPAYEPDRRLVLLVHDLLAADPDLLVLVVDDGSGPDYADIFAGVTRPRCEVIGFDTNQGKGAALKLGVAHIAQRYAGESVVCADCDGQHTPLDIARVAARVVDDDAIVLGARQFTGPVPVRSLVGNAITRGVFRVATGLRLQDTQTGLRGYPASMLGWLLDVPGQRFEYELEVLLAAERAHVPIVEVPIATIYLDGNESSHFRPLHDSVRVYLPFLKFSSSSLSAFVIDAAAFFALMAVGHNLLVAVVGARLLSATVNYLTNHRLVFHSRTAHRRAAWRYATLVVGLLAANYLLMRTLVGPIGLVPAKVVTEMVLFVASYRVQRAVVFGDRGRTAFTANSQPTPGSPASSSDEMAA